MTPLYDLARLGLDPLGSVRHPRYRTAGGEWDALSRIPKRELRILTGARVLTPWGQPPDTAAEIVGAALQRDMTPDDLAAWLRRVVVPAIAEHRTYRQRTARHRRARAAGAVSYYEYRDAYAWLAGYESLWHRRKAVWNG